MTFRPQLGQHIRFTETALTDHWCDELLNYVELFAPKIKTAVAPASPEQIANLTQVASSPLPSTYRHYLEMAGVNRSSLLPNFQAAIGFDASLELYLETKPEELPEGVFLIGYGHNSIYPELGLHVAENPSNPAVVASDGEEIIYTLAESLPHLLFQQAFLGHEIMSTPVRRVYGMVRGQHLLANVVDRCTKLGFKPYDFSDAQNFCGWRLSAAVHIHQIAGGAGWLYLSSMDEATCLQVGNELNHELDLVFLRQEPE